MMVLRVLILLFFLQISLANEVAQPFTPIPYSLKFPIEQNIENLSCLEIDFMVDLDTYQQDYIVEITAVTPTDSFVLHLECIYAAEPCIENSMTCYVGIPLGAWIKTKKVQELRIVPIICYQDELAPGEVWMHIIKINPKFE